MKIGMVTACYKPVINGVTRMISAYKTHLEQAGHAVTIFTLGEPDPAGDEANVIRSPAITLGDTGYYLTMRYNRAAQKRLGEMDIIHCHHLAMSIELAHRYGRGPIVYTNHTRYDIYTGAYMPLLPEPAARRAADALMRQIWPLLTDLCDTVITPSESVRQVMLEFGVRRPMRVIENGIDLQPFQQPPRPLDKQALGFPADAVVAVYVGRLSPEKKLPLLLQQFAAAREIAPRLHLLLVGHGPLAEALKEKAQGLGIEAAATFTGPAPYANVPNYLAAADLFVTASDSEVHPLTVIEALAAGLPIVATASPGIVDSVTAGESGLLTTQASGGLAAGMVALALDPGRRRAMGRAARQVGQRFDIRRTIQKTVALYEELLDTRPDLQRRKAHGYRPRTLDTLQPLLEQLANLLRSPHQKRNKR